MDWNMILGFVFGGTSIGGLITSVIFFKANKKLKENEVKASNEDVEEKQINNDNAQIDLGAKFMQSTLEMTEKMKEMILSSDKERDLYWKKQEAIMNEFKESFSRLEKDVAEIKEEQRLEKEFLNGDYKAFKEQMRIKMEDENKRPIATSDTEHKERIKYKPVPLKKSKKTKQ